MILEQSLPYGLVFVLSICIQVVLCLVLWKLIGKLLAIATLVVGAWFLYFTLRILVLHFNTDPINDHIAVVTSTLEVRSAIWAGTTVGLAALAVGIVTSRALVHERVIHDPSTPIDVTLRLVTFGGIISYVVISTAGIGSGILVNAAQLYLFTLAALAYRSGQRRQVRMVDVGLFALAVFIGPTIGFKEPALVAIIAVTVGYLASPMKVRASVLVVAGISGLLIFSGIQAQRVSYERTGESLGVMDLPSLIVKGVTNDSLAAGEESTVGPSDIIMNPINVALRRVKGPDSIMAIVARTPDQIPHLGGASILQPMLATVPVVDGLFDLEFTQLSLGRYFNYTYWSYRPDEDTSSQAITFPGDLYLNWGWGGVVIGLGLFGALMGAIDRRYPARTAMGAGLFSYAFIPLLSLERGVAYQLVTFAMRLVIGLVFIKFLGGSVTAESTQLDTASVSHARSETRS